MVYNHQNRRAVKFISCEKCEQTAKQLKILFKILTSCEKSVQNKIANKDATNEAEFDEI